MIVLTQSMCRHILQTPLRIRRMTLQFRRPRPDRRRHWPRQLLPVHTLFRPCLPRIAAVRHTHTMRLGRQRKSRRQITPILPLIATHATQRIPQQKHFHQVRQAHTRSPKPRIAAKRARNYTLRHLGHRSRGIRRDRRLVRPIRHRRHLRLFRCYWLLHAHTPQRSLRPLGYRQHGRTAMATRP